jgi:hypothetical protein
LIAWGNTTDRILYLLQDKHLTKVEICSKLDLSHDNTSAVLTRLKRSKRIYISDWTRFTLGKRLYLRPIYTLGAKPDAKKPPAFTNKERSARSHIKKMQLKKAIKLTAWMTI